MNATIRRRSPELNGGTVEPFHRSSKQKRPKHRLTVLVPEPFYRELKDFSVELGRSIGDSIRWMFGISLIIWEELQNGNRIAVVRDGKIIKEIGIPR